MYTDLFITSATDYRHRAACRPVGKFDPDAVRDMAEKFYPIASPGTEQYDTAVAEAKDICAGCPVRAECLAEALDRPQRADAHGVLGGLDHLERAAVRRAARLPRDRELAPTA